MRKSRDSEATKKTVVATARTVFAEKGFSGSSLAMIAEKSGISNGLILYHFKSKENLYEIVLEDLASEYIETIASHRDYSRQPEEMIQEMLSATFKYWSEDATYNRISTWAYLENRPEIISGETRLTAGLAAGIADMQASGKIDTRFSPVVLLSMTIGPILFWIQHRELFRQSLHLEGTEEQVNTLFLEQYTLLIKKLFDPTKL